MAKLNGNNGKGNILFLLPCPNRTIRRFSTKQHLLCQLLIARILSITRGCTYVILIKKVGKLVKVQLRKALIKYYNIEKKSIIKLFKFKPKVKFILLDWDDFYPNFKI